MTTIEQLEKLYRSLDGSNQVAMFKIAQLEANQKFIYEALLNIVDSMYTGRDIRVGLYAELKERLK